MEDDEIMPPECAAWRVEVDRVMKRDWYIDTDEAGLSVEEIVRFWRYGDTPEEFVRWFAEDRELFDFNDIFRRRPPV